MDLDFQPPKNARAKTSSHGGRHHVTLIFAVLFALIGIFWGLLHIPQHRHHTRVGLT